MQQIKTEILFNLLMRQSKEERGYSTKGRIRLIKPDNIEHMELNPCPAEPEGPVVPGALQ